MNFLTIAIVDRHMSRQFGAALSAQRPRLDGDISTRAPAARAGSAWPKRLGSDDTYHEIGSSFADACNPTVTHVHASWSHLPRDTRAMPADLTVDNHCNDVQQDAAG